MSVAGESADQIVKVSLDGVDIMLRLAGDATKDIARLLIQESRKPQRTKGRASLLEMFKQQTPVKVFEVEEKSLKTFCKEAKRYGVLYHVLKNKNSNSPVCDVLVRAEDIDKVNRILSRFNIGRDKQTLIRETIEKHKEESTPPPMKTQPEKDETAKLVDELFKKQVNAEKVQTNVPLSQKTDKAEPSIMKRKQSGDMTLPRTKRFTEQEKERQPIKERMETAKAKSQSENAVINNPPKKKKYKERGYDNAR